MLVRAIRVGYYDHKRRYPKDFGHKMSGEPFELKSKEEISLKWMEPADKEAEAAFAEVRAEAKPLPVPLIDESGMEVPPATPRKRGRPRRIPESE
jgi:hypothetical protein